MRSLREFEDWVSGTLEGRLGALLGGHAQPVDIAKRIAQAMDDRRTTAGRHTYVPNVYRVYLGPVAYSEIAPFAGVLEAELAEFVRRRASENGYALAAPPSVRLLVDAELGGDRIRVDASISEAPLGGGNPDTRAIELGDVTDQPAAVRMAVVQSGRGPVQLAGKVVTMGRALENDVIVDHPSVSRHHARLLPRGAYWLLEDLGSLHGCFVNGQRVTSSLLRPGDELRLGAAVLELVSSTAR